VSWPSSGPREFPINHLVRRRAFRLAHLEQADLSEVDVREGM
jgi:hypothetical protein